MDVSKNKKTNASSKKNISKTKSKIVKKVAKKNKPLKTVLINSGQAAYFTLQTNGDLTKLLEYLNNRKFPKDYGWPYIVNEINASLNINLTIDDLKGIINFDKKIANALSFDIDTNYDPNKLENVEKTTATELIKAMFQLAVGGNEVTITETTEDIVNSDGYIMGEKKKKKVVTKRRLGNVGAMELYLNLIDGRVKTQHKAIDIDYRGKQDEDYFAGIDIDGLFDEVADIEVDMNNIGEIVNDDE